MKTVYFKFKDKIVITNQVNLSHVCFSFIYALFYDRNVYMYLSYFFYDDHRL